jgi:tRNA pseudouridine32 synthase/23S rRNA pseudouridine746 synthase
LNLEPLHLDAHLMVVDKPAGLLAVPGRGADKQDCLAGRLQVRWPGTLTVHRLDMGTSGLMVFARDAVTQAALGLAFAQRRVSKHYEAVVNGIPVQADRDADGWSRIDLPLAADWPRRPLQKVCHAQGKPSATLWRTVGPEPALGGTRLELQPLTGRTHQLRVHLQAIGHVILGDGLYAQGDALARAPRLLLHARTLAFTHPVTGATLRFDGPPPF